MDTPTTAIVQRHIDDPRSGRRKLDKQIEQASRGIARQAKQVERQIEAVDARREAVLLLLMAADVQFGSSWGDVAATLAWNPQDSYFIVAGAFLFLSFVAGCVYHWCRGWGVIAQSLSTLFLMFLRPVAQIADTMRDSNTNEPPQLKQFKEADATITQHLGDDENAMSGWAELWFNCVWVFTMAAVVFYVTWLFEK